MASEKKTLGTMWALLNYDNVLYVAHRRNDVIWWAKTKTVNGEKEYKKARREGWLDIVRVDISVREATE